MILLSTEKSDMLVYTVMYKYHKKKVQNLQHIQYNLNTSMKIEKVTQRRF